MFIAEKRYAIIAINNKIDELKQKIFGSIGLVISTKDIKKEAVVSTEFRCNTIKKVKQLNSLTKSIDATCGNVKCKLYCCRTFISDMWIYTTTYKKFCKCKIFGRYISLIKLTKFAGEFGDDFEEEDI